MKWLMKTIIEKFLEVLGAYFLLILLLLQFGL